jgi:Holliday junction resolvase RusA-like endonuclease
MDKPFGLHEPNLALVEGARLISGIQEPTRIQKSGGDEACFRLIREMADLPVVARFTIEGEPKSKARPRFTRNGRAYSPEANIAAEKEIGRLFRQTVPGYEPDDEYAYGVMALFFYGTMTRRDVDNMMKLILDGLNGIAWPDDRQVSELSGRKALTIPANARTEIVVYRVGKVQHFTAACTECGTEFTLPRLARPTGRYAQKFCSRECAFAYKTSRAREPRTCLTCGNLLANQNAKQCRQCWKDRGKVIEVD